MAGCVRFPAVNDLAINILRHRHAPIIAGFQIFSQPVMDSLSFRREAYRPGKSIVDVYNKFRPGGRDMLELLPE